MLPFQVVEQNLPLLLIGRRDIRSNNSWMHNSQRLVKGKARWHCYMNPKDMADRGLSDGQGIRLKSRVGEVESFVQMTEDLMPGVVCMPHGWGHSRAGVRLSIATEQQGPSMNDLTDDQFFDHSTGNAALNGVPVEVSLA